jgi:hypothetical protein
VETPQGLFFLWGGARPRVPPQGDPARKAGAERRSRHLERASRSRKSATRIGRTPEVKQLPKIPSRKGETRVEVRLVDVGRKSG